MASQSSTTSQYEWHQLLFPLFVTLGILAIVVGCSKVVLPLVHGDRTGNDGELRHLPSVKQESVFGLVNPHNGDNGTNPAQTTTEECTRDFTLPVLGGIDVVAYSDLHEGDPPVFGNENLMTVYYGYRFNFSMLENLLDFEVSKPKVVLPVGYS